MHDLLWKDTLTHLFAYPQLAVAEKALRPVVVYAALVILLRVFGKRELAQLNSFDPWCCCYCPTPSRTQSSEPTTRYSAACLAPPC